MEKDSSTNQQIFSPPEKIPAVKSAKGKQFLLYALFFLIGIGAALYLHWPALTNYARYKSDIRQAPHWAAYHNTSFQSDDLLVKLGAYNESPLQNIIYYVGTYFIEMVTLTKVLAILSYGLGALLFFAIGRALFGLRGGCLTAIFFTFFPDQFDYSTGFFSKFWMIPCLAMCIYILQKERWSWLLPLMAFAAIAYPVTAILIGMTVFVHTILLAIEDKKKSWRCLCYLVLSSAVAVSLLLMKYYQTPDFIGPMPSRDALFAMPEMYKGGLNFYLPVPALYKELLSYISHPFVIYSTIFYFIILKKEISWHKSWTALLIASIICYLLADYFFIQFYIPNRYTRYSIAVLLILWNARNWDLILEKIPQVTWRYVVVILMLLVASYAYQDTFRQNKGTMNRKKNAPLCQFIEQLPEKILVAGHPKYMDDIPVKAKRSVLCNYKMAHPWYSTYYKEIKKRTKNTFRALYATNIEPINALYNKYGVTHLVIRKSHYKKSKLQKKDIYVNPYNDFIYRLTKGKKKFLLKSPPKKSIVYEDKRFFVIKLPLDQ